MNGKSRRPSPELALASACVLFDDRRLSEAAERLLQAPGDASHAS